MTPDEIKASNCAVAEKLGWKRSYGFKQALLGAPTDYISPSGETNLPPNYVLDANTRPEMLAALTEDEKRELVCFVFPVRPYGWTIDKPIQILELSQPDFCKLWLKVKKIEI